MIRNPQNSTGNYFGPYSKPFRGSELSTLWERTGLELTFPGLDLKCWPTLCKSGLNRESPKGPNN